MKSPNIMNKYIVLVAVLMTSSLASAQTIRRVNNNVGVTGLNVYASPQAAHDAAVANDIVVIEPSATTYTEMNLTKPLKIYGNGYFLSTNTELKVDPRSSTINSFKFNVGSAGSMVSGVDVLSGGIQIYGVSNITIQRCYIRQSVISIITNNSGGAPIASVSNILIQQNYINSGSSNLAVIATPTSGNTISNVSITNNIMDGVSANDDTYIQNWIVRHNTITNGNSTSLRNGIFENNLCTGISGGNVYTVNFNNVSASYNVSRGVSTFSGGTGNQNNIDATGEFVPTGAGISTDETYQLKVGSVLKTAGSAGSEVGAFGGPTPYVISGIAAVPSITGMTNTATGSNTTPLQVTISVKSNN